MEFDELPNDSTIEKALVSALLADTGKLLDVATFLQPEAFYNARCRAIYTGLYELYSRHKPIDLITLSNQLLALDLYDQAGQKENLAQLAAQTNGVNVKELGHIVQDFYIRRREINFRDLVTVTAFDRTKDVGDRLTLMQREIAEIQRLVIQDENALGWPEFADFYFNLLNQREQAKRQPKLHFHWDGLRDLMPSLFWGDMVALVGDPGAGKTSFLEQQAESWWQQGWKGVFYHLELAPERMADRRIARHTGVSLGRLQDSRDAQTYLSEHEHALVRTALSMMNEWAGNLWLKHCPGWTMTQITADMKKRAEVGGIKFVILDYFNKVRSVPRSKNSYTAYDRGQDIEDFKVALEELGLVGMIGAQFDKGAKSRGKRRSLADARDTAELDDKAQVGISIERPRGEDGVRSEYCDVAVVKCNSGREGKVGMRMDGPRFRFIEQEN